MNPLSYLCIEVIRELNLTHPAVYIRLSRNAPEDFLRLCGEYLIKGGNRTQLLNDESIIGALTASGVSFGDAVDYFCGGCMKIGVQGKNSDFLYTGFFNTVKLAELAITGGVCLQSGARVGGVRFAGLESCSSFEDFYRDFLAETAYFKTFFQNGGQIFQGNVVDAELLEKAMEHPENYPNLIVRVGGYSARFANLPEKLRKEIVGKCMLRVKFLARVLERCRAEGIRTAVDTAGFVPWSPLKEFCRIPTCFCMTSRRSGRKSIKSIPGFPTDRSFAISESCCKKGRRCGFGFP